MKHKHIIIVILTLCMVLSLAACDRGNDTEETTAGTPVTDTPTEEATEAPTDPDSEDVTAEETKDEATEELTEASTEDPAESEESDNSAKKYREDWDDDDPENPFYNLVPVGKSYDGKTTCYDGRYDFGWAVCQTADGQYFQSVQEAIWHLEEMGGGAMLMTSNTDICLRLEFPDDGCDYRLYYQFLNVDFVFNRGNVYDDCTPNENGINGYAYYSDLFVLDGFSGLGETKVWMMGGNEGFDDLGCYIMIDEFNDDPDYLYVYQYVLESNIDSWAGLPLGEYLPED